MTDNPFYTPSPLPFEAPDFSRISDDHFMPAFEKGMNEHLEEISAIADNPEQPTFENTLVALEQSGELLNRVSRVFFNLTAAHTNETLQKIQSELAPRLAAHSDDILLNRNLFNRIETLYKRKDELNPDEASAKLLSDTRRDFVRAGALLDAGGQKRMRKINERISTLTTRFQENLLALTNERAVLIKDRELLKGLSKERLASAKKSAEEKGEKGKYRLTITNTTRQPVLASLENREMRQKIWEASANRGIGENGGIDNRPLLIELAKLRAERAQLLGYKTYAHYALEPQTGEHPDRVLEMLNGLIPAVKRNADREAEMITQKMREDGLSDDLQPWDWEYYAEKVRKEQFDIDEEEVRPYFELNRVLKDGLFYTMKRFYGISFEERDDIPVWHESVRVFDVFDEDGIQIGLFYADHFSRDSKRGGAWMSTFVIQSHLRRQKPVIMNVLNITPPAEGDPALITFDNVTTLFHEMGHAVHGLFSDVQYPSQAGTSVPRDFVEFPSTFEEDWAINPDVLRNYAVHHETGEPIPEELIERLIAAREFNQGFDTYEYLAAAMVDLKWHMLKPDEIPDDVQQFEQNALGESGLNHPAIPPRYRSPYFSHIFAGGYAANYYAYVWSEVLAADAFYFIKQNGSLSRESGDRYRETVLSKGGSREAMEIYREFRGDEPDVEHLLRRRGLTE